jgi:hypothetical protein
MIICMWMTNCAAHRAFAQHNWSSACIYESIRVHDYHEFKLHREPHLRGTYNPPFVCFHLHPSIMAMRFLVAQNQHLRHSCKEFSVHRAYHSAYLQWHQLSHWSARASTIKAVVVPNLASVLVFPLLGYGQACVYRDSGSMTMEQ